MQCFNVKVSFFLIHIINFKSLSIAWEYISYRMYKFITLVKFAMYFFEIALWMAFFYVFGSMEMFSIELNFLFKKMYTSLIEIFASCNHWNIKVEDLSLCLWLQIGVVMIRKKWKITQHKRGFDLRFELKCQQLN